MDIINKAADDEREGPFNKYASIYFGGLGYYITAFYGIEEVREYLLQAETESYMERLIRESFSFTIIVIYVTGQI